MLICAGPTCESGRASARFGAYMHPATLKFGELGVPRDGCHSIRLCSLELLLRR